MTSPNAGASDWRRFIPGSDEHDRARFDAATLKLRARGRLYDTTATCSNCGFSGTLSDVMKGQAVVSRPCPMCGCKLLRPTAAV